MIKARKQDISRLEDLSRELNRGLALLMSDKYEIMRPASHRCSTDIFTAGFYPNEQYYKIAKDYGNDLVPMFSAIKSLAKLLQPDVTKCPDCGSTEMSLNPADNSKYICKDCGCFYD